MKDKGINSMIIDAISKLCDQGCRNSARCNSMCDESQHLIDMIFKYPIMEFNLEDEDSELGENYE